MGHRKEKIGRSRLKRVSKSRIGGERSNREPKVRRELGSCSRTTWHLARAPRAPRAPTGYHWQQSLRTPRAWCSHAAARIPPSCRIRVFSCKLKRENLPLLFTCTIPRILLRRFGSIQPSFPRAGDAITVGSQQLPSFFFLSRVSAITLHQKQMYPCSTRGSPSPLPGTSQCTLAVEETLSSFCYALSG